jgi:hypothetical protein
MPLNAAWPTRAMGKKTSEAKPMSEQLMLHMAATHLPALSQQGQGLSVEELVACPPSSIRPAGADAIVFAAATGESTSPMLTSIVRINLVIGMRVTAYVLSTCASPA